MQFIKFTMQMFSKPNNGTLLYITIYFDFILSTSIKFHFKTTCLHHQNKIIIAKEIPKIF